MIKQRPTKAEIERAKMEIHLEDVNRLDGYWDQPDVLETCAENNRRMFLPPEDPEHLCGECDGLDGQVSYCWRLREKLGFHG